MTHLLSRLACWGVACLGFFACTADGNEKAEGIDSTSTGGQGNADSGDGDDGSGGSDNRPDGETAQESSCQELALCCPLFGNSIDHLRCTGVVGQNQGFACSGLLTLYSDFCAEVDDGSGGDGGASGSGGGGASDDCFDHDADSDTPCVNRSLCNETALKLEATAAEQDRLCGEWVVQFGSDGYTRNHGLALDNEGARYPLCNLVQRRMTTSTELPLWGQVNCF